MSHQTEFDEYGHKDHGHFIVPAITLRAILTLLMFFTLLTVGAAQAEQWVSHTFSVEIPQWMNVFVALSIATVKTILVVLFFMQLKYDNPMNSLIMVFTAITVACFLGFTALDLGQRATIDRFKSHYLMPGGTGGVRRDNVVIEGPITVFARNTAIANGTFHADHMHAHSHLQDITNAGFLPVAPTIGSSSNLSRPVEGITLTNLPGFKAPASAHGEHAAGEHAPTPVPAAPVATPAAAPAHAAPAATPAHAEPAKPGH